VHVTEHLDDAGLEQPHLARLVALLVAAEIERLRRRRREHVVQHRISVGERHLRAALGDDRVRHEGPIPLHDLDVPFHRRLVDVLDVDVHGPARLSLHVHAPADRRRPGVGGGRRLRLALAACDGRLRRPRLDMGGRWWRRQDDVPRCSRPALPEQLDQHLVVLALELRQPQDQLVLLIDPLPQRREIGGRGRARLLLRARRLRTRDAAGQRAGRRGRDHRGCSFADHLARCSFQ
jgi:hypothetical protein